MSAEDQNHPTFHEVFVPLLSESGLTINALAKRSGLDPAGVGRLYHGTVGNPRVSTIRKLITGFNFEPGDERAGRLFDAAGIKEPPELVAGIDSSQPRPLLEAITRLENKVDRLIEIMETHFKDS